MNLKSKVDVELNQVSAANAITILVRAGVEFRGADLRDIKIPGADLSYGQFDYAQFQGANLTGVNFARGRLRQVDMSGAKMDGLRFGELSYLVADDLTSACGYSPDGKLLAVSVWSGVIDVYETTTWSKVRGLRGHVGGSSDVTFSPDSQRIVTAGKGKTARVWEVADNGEALLVLEGHTSSLLIRRSLLVARISFLAATTKRSGCGLLRRENVISCWRDISVPLGVSDFRLMGKHSSRAVMISLFGSGMRRLENQELCGCLPLGR